ncbi:MAG: HlyD family secretion protein [Alphaproteobacteria bacterium]
MPDTEKESPETKDSDAKDAAQHKPARRGRGWVRYLVLVLVLGIGGYLGVQEIISRFTHVYEYDARIGSNLITVSSRVAGWIDRVRVTEGDETDRGQVIVEIDSRESKLLVTQLEARIQGIEADRQRLMAEKKLVDIQTSSRYRTEQALLGTAEAELAALKPQLQLAQSEFQRSRSLFEKKIIARKQYDEALAREQQLSGEHRTALAAVQAARNKMAEAEAERAQLDVLDSEIAKLVYEENELRAQLARQKLDLGDRKIRAPVKGVIDKTFVDMGEYVTPGQRLVLMHDPETIWVEANVKETEVRKLRIGQRVEISVDAYPGEGLIDRALALFGVASQDNGDTHPGFIGHVIAIGNSTTAEFALLPSPNPSGNFTKITQRLPVRIAVEQRDRKLRPGMMVEINIDIRDN